MELFFGSDTLQRACTEERESDRLWGADCARIIRRRLAQLAAAESLAVIATVAPAKLRPLPPPRDGVFAVDALPPLCLMLEPRREVVSLLPDGSLDKTKITAVRILAVEPFPSRRVTHGR